MIDDITETAALVHDMGITKTEIERRLCAVRFTDDDIRRIRGLREVIAGYADRASADFIGYLTEASEVPREVRERLVHDQVGTLKKAHILSMVECDYDLRYVTQRVRLAVIYSRAGLDIKWFLGAFHHLMRGLGIEILQRGKADPEQAFHAFLSLEKIVCFDIALMVDCLIFQRERVIHRQQEAIRELSTPVLQLRTGLLILPLIGAIDGPRARQLTEHLLAAIRERRARVVLLDITGAASLDTSTANHLLLTIEAARLMGATTILSGMSAGVAQALVTIGVDLSQVRTAGDLEQAMDEAAVLLEGRAGSGECPP